MKRCTQCGARIDEDLEEAGSCAECGEEIEATDDKKARPGDREWSPARDDGDEDESENEDE